MRNSIKIFVEEGMEVKLKQNDEIKTPWEFLSMQQLYTKLKEERFEVGEALENWRNTGHEIERQAFMMELADEANVLMMMFSLLHQVSRHYRRGNPIPRLPVFPNTKYYEDHTQDPLWHKKSVNGENKDA